MRIALALVLLAMGGGAAAQQAAPLHAPVGPLGIAPGYYVDVATPCPEAHDIFFYDGKRVGVPRYDRNGDATGLEVLPVGRVTRARDGSLFIETLEIELRKLPGGRIALTIHDDGPAMRICRPDQVPARFRAR
ncbi:hypothetical protein [Sphingomonas sp. G-3-2-10]|jgi:hypothetical protein|uniref:hypothetical protein n=1 Tax=Sphingomonas sp. G-3-2-10 TaxID=2728838 RepID=UPI00146E5CC5|nr:hypothetical protein [Sphingomonas sp. G-3-2-10]NML08049.1 hypothetical protein [Sphingomonas sp. G-3-2-10]